MFSIAAINDVDASQGHWEPLAPTKEAQEFRLTQLYQESLLQLQSGEYVKAQKLLQAIIQDPLCIKAEEENTMNLGSMLQLRFLAFKNLAESFYKQGSNHYSDALHCYLQAVAIDGKDVVVWNRLGTLACSVGSLNIARRAFEQGLCCNPHHWGCMEKLVEVLIAIGDEVACLAVVKKLIKISPSHPRAQFVRHAIEESADVEDRKVELGDSESLKFNGFALRGIDKLKPQHFSLSFLGKRKTDHSIDFYRSSKKKKYHKILLNLQEASWSELVKTITHAFKEAYERVCREINAVKEPDEMGKAKASSGALIANATVMFSLRLRDSSQVEIFQPQDERSEAAEGQREGLSTSYTVVCDPAIWREQVEESFHDKRSNLEVSGRTSFSVEGALDRSFSLKEKDASTDEEPPSLERRSTRLERLRTRKFEKGEEGENAFSELGRSKDSSKVLRQLLEPFIVCGDDFEVASLFLSDNTEAVKAKSVSDSEEKEVLHFLKEKVHNSGLYHITQELLERISKGIRKSFNSWIEFTALEKSTRNVGERSALCSLFLAEIYMDLAMTATKEHDVSDYMNGTEYNLCKVLETIAAMTPAVVIAWDKEVGTWGTLEADKQKTDLPVPELEMCGYDWSFSVRYYWLSGRARNFLGKREEAKEDFQRCLSIFEARERTDKASPSVLLFHCKVDQLVSVERVRHKIYELQIEDLLEHSAAKMLDQGDYAELINLLTPILFSKGRREKGTLLLGVGKKNTVDFSAELTALDMLVSACEKSRPRNVLVALQSHERRLEIFRQAADLANLKGFGSPLHSSVHNTISFKSEQQAHGVGRSGDWFKMVKEEVKHISRCAATLGEKIGEPEWEAPDGKLLGRIQQLLLTIMCHIARMLAARKSSGLGSSEANDQVESSAFVDAAVAFCRLQHLFSAISMEQQVALLVTVHEVLAERGLCCAGKACEGGEGAFLKMAIKRLLALEMQLKVRTSPLICRLGTDKIEDGNLSAGMPPPKIKGTAKGSDIELDVEEGSHSCDDGFVKADEATARESRVMGFEEAIPEKRRKMDLSSHSDEQISDVEKKKMELGLDIALDQSFFCLYGLNLKGGSDSTGQDGLAVHANTNLGDYQTKEQCAGVFQYLLPYAKVCSRPNLLKLRKVLRAIRKLFPEPPKSALENNVVDTFLDDLELDEVRLRDMVLSGKSMNEILDFAFQTPGTVPKEPELQDKANPINNSMQSVADECKNDIVGCLMVDADFGTSGLYCEVYGNLYYLLTQVEEMSASDKWPGFVFTKDGEEFVDQNAKLFKYDLLYNPLRFESWHKLANIYDEEVDLMLNDGSKTYNATVWRKTLPLTSRVENGRRHSRRCLLMSLALARTREQQSQVHELLALVYYDTLQNVVPSYDQRHHVAMRDSSWKTVCENSMKHFEKAFSYKPEWIHLFYLGKLCEKVGASYEKALSYYKKAVEMNPSAVDPIYRLHASRLKLLCSLGTQNINVTQVVARYCYLPPSKEVSALLLNPQLNIGDLVDSGNCGKKPYNQSLSGLKDNNIKDAWNSLFEDCMKALEVCIEGELKHFHKARFRLAQGLFSRNEGNDIERAKEELAFCFRSNRSLFTINMWEIDGSTKRSRRKAPGSTGSRRGLELAMPESSRKFITCLRKYLLLYLHLCERTGDICTLERAYSSLRVDKRFSFCLADMINVALGEYIYALGSAVSQAGIAGSSSNCSLKFLLEKIFNLFMEHGSSWSEVAGASLAELGSSSASDMSEATIYGYIHQYLYSLESGNKVDVLESVNEKIRRRFKSPKLVNAHCAQVCRHAALAWCRALCFALSAITPLGSERSVTDFGSEGSTLSNIEQTSQLVVELHSDELMTNPYEAYCPKVNIEDLEQDSPALNMRGICVKQAYAENAERALVLLRQTFTFYRDCAGPFPHGINLFLKSSGMAAANSSEVNNNVSPGSLVNVDLSVPRKLLLWAFTLVHGRTCSIAEAVRFCEDQAKTRMKRGSPAAGTQMLSSTSQERNVGCGNKEMPSSTYQQTNTTFAVEDKEKSMFEEPELGDGGSFVVPSIDHMHPGSSSLATKQFFEDVTQVEESSHARCWESCYLEKNH